MKRWALRRGWMALLAVLGAAALAGPATAAPGGRDTVVIGMAQEPDRLGAFSIMVAAAVVEHALFAQAAPFTDRWVRMPVMLEKLPSLKDGDWVLLPNNKMKVTWRLRRGFTLHPRPPGTAPDRRAPYTLFRNPQTPPGSRLHL